MNKLIELYFRAISNWRSPWYMPPPGKISSLFM